MINGETLQKIKDLYELYDFTVGKETNEYIVFLHAHGYFYNAEIIKYKSNAEVTIVKKEYEDLGYSVREIEFSTIKSFHDNLFEGFFDIDNFQRKLKQEYDAFCELQCKKLGANKYEYIQPSYYVNDVLEKNSLAKRIMLQLNENGSQLIILEAAAGYGKTTTSYEIIKKISEDSSISYTPIFAELSKNRRASLFRYVLLDEIDRKFSMLSSRLVLHEIQNGRVPLIIDGFDELISRSNSNMNVQNENDEDSQTMLDTIAEMFAKGVNTKVILTTRKSALFTGEVFEEWAKNHLQYCNVTRISIEDPSIEDWIGYERKNILEDRGIPLTSLMNPILLAFIRNLTTSDFDKLSLSVESVISFYFNSILTREKERQSLNLSVDEQFEVMKKLAFELAEFDIDSEELSFIRDLISDVIKDKIDEYIDRYIQADEKPSKEEFASKLAGHALLNRINPKKNNIGFINDFIFGVFIGDSLIDDPQKVEQISPQFIELAAIAYASRDYTLKFKLFNVIQPKYKSFNYEQQLLIDIKLMDTICRDYIDHFFKEFTFNEDTFFDGQFQFINCQFKNCTFQSYYVSTSSFINCQFYNCRFYILNIERDTTYDCKLIFSDKCFGYEEWEEKSKYYVEQQEQTDYEYFILKKFDRLDDRNLRRRISENALLKSKDPQTKQNIELALESLNKKNLIRKNGRYWFINQENKHLIADILWGDNDGNK